MFSELSVLYLPLPYLYETRPWFKFRVKFAAYYLWLTSMSLVMIPLSLLRPGSVDNARLGSLLMNPLSKVLDLDWQVEGEVELLQREESCVIVANHQSSIDLLGMFVIWSRLRRVAALAKQSLMYYGSFGITAALCGTIFVDRSNPQLAAERLNTVSRRLKEEKIKLWIFPEGTRNGDKDVPMLPFKKGAFHVAVNSDLPILPIVIARHSFLDAGSRIFSTGCGRMTVLPLIWPQGRSVEELRDLTREAMLKQLQGPDVTREAMLMQFQEQEVEELCVASSEATARQIQ